MALAPELSSSTDPVPLESNLPPVDAPGLNYFVFALFFIFGGCCQSDANSSPPGAVRPKFSWPYAARFCHSTRATERRALNVSLSTR